MNKQNFKVFIVDDDLDITQSLTLLLKSISYNVSSYNDIQQFIKNENYDGAGCILLDVFLDGKTSLELQEVIETKFESLPIIFISGQGSVPMSVEALKKGAINFLEKPLDEQALVKALDEALSRSEQLITKNKEIDRLRALMNTLTAREYEIFRYVISGMLNKQIAAELGIAEHTIKNHRLNITDKLKVKSVAELVNIAEKLSIKGAAVNHSS
ncbi:MAG: response regulator [Ignavibacterium sp.]|jgi:FixJ family two-component response regulator|nr:response regulator [Ignavibacterium sp.]